MVGSSKWSGVAWDNIHGWQPKKEAKKASFYWEKSIRKCKKRVLIYAKVVKIVEFVYAVKIRRQFKNQKKVYKVLWISRFI